MRFWDGEWRFRPSPTYTDPRFTPLFSSNYAASITSDAWIYHTDTVTIQSTATITVNEQKDLSSAAQIAPAALITTTAVVYRTDTATISANATITVNELQTITTAAEIAPTVTISSTATITRRETITIPSAAQITRDIITSAAHIYRTDVNTISSDALVVYREVKTIRSAALIAKKVGKPHRIEPFMKVVRIDPADSQHGFEIF